VEPDRGRFDRKGRHSGGRFAGLATKGQRYRFRNLSSPGIEVFDNGDRAKAKLW